MHYNVTIQVALIQICRKLKPHLLHAYVLPPPVNKNVARVIYILENN